MIQDDGDRYVPFNPDVLNRMTWEQMIEESSRMEEQDNLWKQANAQNVMQLAGLKSRTELRSQAEMMVRNGRLGTVKSAEEAIRQDWLSRGYIVK